MRVSQTVAGVALRGRSKLQEQETGTYESSTYEGLHWLHPNLQHLGGPEEHALQVAAAAFLLTQQTRKS